MIETDRGRLGRIKCFTSVDASKAEEFVDHLKREYFNSALLGKFGKSVRIWMIVFAVSPK
jgi:hypothetical protein